MPSMAANPVLCSSVYKQNLQMVLRTAVPSICTSLQHQPYLSQEANTGSTERQSPFQEARKELASDEGPYDRRHCSI